MNTKFKIAAYLALVCVALAAAVIVWENIAPRRWFYCYDSVGFSFIPPFAHTDFATYGQTDDYYIATPRFVYSVWASFVAAAFLLPAFVIFALPHSHRATRTNPQ